jgi:hypothetical protein
MNEESQTALGVCGCCKPGVGYEIKSAQEEADSGKKKTKSGDADELAESSKGKMVMKG